MPRYSLHVTLHARVDLKTIAEYSLDHWGRAAQALYLADLGSIFSQLLDQPELGRSREDLGPGLRSVSCAQHLVVYLVRGDEVAIIRILHQRMDARSALTEE